MSITVAMGTTPLPSPLTSVTGLVYNGVMREGRNYPLLATAVTALLMLASGCRSSEASPPTTPPPMTTAAPTTKPTVAPPTTTTAPTTTTTIPPTTAPPTTPPPTTAPNATPEELLGQRAITRNTDLEKCYAAPDHCDIEAYLDEYYHPGATARDRIRKRFDGLVAKGLIWTEIDQNETSLASVSISPDGTLASTEVCSKNAAVELNAATGEVVDNDVGYFVYKMTWRRSDTGQWLIVDANSEDASPGANSPCGF